MTLASAAPGPAREPSGRWPGSAASLSGAAGDAWRLGSRGELRGPRGPSGASGAAERAAWQRAGSTGSVMNFDETRQPPLLNSLGGLGGGRDREGSRARLVTRCRGGPDDSPGEPRPWTAAAPDRGGGPGQGAGPRRPRGSSPDTANSARAAVARPALRPALGGLGTRAASELICLQTPSPCQRQ